MTRVQLQIQYNSAVNIADKIDSHLQIQGHHLQRIRVPRGLQQGLVPEMVMSEEDEATHLPHEGVIVKIPLQEKGVLFLLLGVDVAPLLHQDVAGLPLLDEDHHLHLPEDDLHLRDVTLLPFSVAIVHHLCPLKKGKCPLLLQDVLLQEPNADLQDPPNGGALRLKEDAPLPLPHLHPDTGGVHYSLVVQKGIVATLPLHLTAAVILGVLPVLAVAMTPPTAPHPAIENRGLQTTNLFVECLVHRNHAIIREHP